MSARPQFFLIDGHAMAYRQYFALNVNAFSTRSGEPTNAVFGFARTLLDILQKNRPQYLAVSFDQGLTGREVLFPDYKGTRDKMPNELDVQIPRLYQLVRAFNIPILEREGCEADDVIGSVLAQIEAEGVSPRIITGDRDLLQLLNEENSVQLPSRNGPDVVWDIAKFREEYGFEPHQLTDYKGLVGDTSDNIPGVNGIGEKTATTLLQMFGSIDGIYQHISEIKGAQQKKLIEGQDSAYLSKDLATIRRNLPIEIKLADCSAHDYDPAAVAELFRELEFRSLSDRLSKVQQSTAPAQMSMFESDDEFSRQAAEFAPLPDLPPAAVPFGIAEDTEKLALVVEKLNNASIIAFDTETTSTDQMSAELVGISLAVDGEAGFYIPVGHKSGQQLPLQAVIDAIRPAMTNPHIAKVGHNASYDLVILRRHGIDVSPITFDTMIAEFLCDPLSKFLGLKNLVRQELGVVMTEITELIGTGKKQITMDAVLIEQAAPYAAADAVLTFRLVDILRPRLATNSVEPLFDELEIPLIPIIADIEQAGVALDINYLKELSKHMDNLLREMEQQIYTTSGGQQFNINSPKQLNEVLFDRLNISTKGIRKTTHGLSTAADVLENLRDEHPIIPLILEYREISKLKGTYVDALPLLVNPYTGRVHTSYNQTGAATGRLSSSNPNLQNIPIRTELGREVRRAIISPPGMYLLSVDYSQVELRIMAHTSGEKYLLDAFASGQDIHAATASLVYGVPLIEVNKAQRNFAKRVNFGLLYGMGAFRLARDSDLTLAEADQFIKTYFERLPEVKRYLDETKRLAAEQGFLTTLRGRRRNFPVLYNSANRSDRNAIAQEEREAINYPIQGTAADIIKQAMINLHRELNARKLGARMILQVHDELVLEVPEERLKKTAALVVEVMEAAYQLDAPLQANAAFGTNWRDMESISRA